MSRATIYLVRHAEAGQQRPSNDDDITRPLSTAGWKQAESLGERLAERGATRAMSSPHVRCLQTLEPLARRIDRSVAPDDRLLEGAEFEGVLDLIADAPSGTVLCSHGDIIPAVIQALVRRGMRVQTPSDWRKSTIWVLHRNGTRVTEGEVWPPPSSGAVT